MLWFVVGLIAIALAVTVLCAVRLRTTRRAIAHCQEWRLVTGRVITRLIREVPHNEFGTEYVPVVVYRYVVNDTQYESEHLTIGGHVRYLRRRNAERRLAHYGEGQVVQVHVDPMNPASSVLECRTPMVTVLWTMLVIIWIVMIGSIGVLLTTPGVIGPDAVFRL